jgi:hypothetical protein
MFVPAKGGQGKIARTDIVVGMKNEIKILCGYGMQGGKVEIRVFSFPECLKQLCPQDEIKVQFNDCDPARPLLLKVVNTKWSPPGNNNPGAWSFFIQAEFESSWNVRRRVIANVRSDKKMNYIEVIRKVFDSASFTEDKPIVEEGKGVGVYGYTSYFLDGEISLKQTIDDIVDENGAEWYCDPFTNAICVGSPAATRDIGGGSSNTSSGVTRYQFFEMSGQWFASFVFEGSADTLIGGSLLIEGKRYKIIKCVYGARGDGYRECTGIAAENKVIVKKRTNQHFTLNEIDSREGYNAERQTKVVDLMVPDGDSYGISNKALWLRERLKGSGNEKPAKDPRDFVFVEGSVIDSIIKSSPFAGDGVGMKFPVLEKARHLLVFPEKKSGYSILSGMVWKKDDTVPKCEPKDLYLRMEKGSLYFDEANKTWLVKAEKVKLEAAAPDAADTKPNPTTTTGTFIKLENGGTVTIEGTTIKLGKNANNPVARKGDLQAIVDMINGHGHATVTSLGTPTGPVAAAPPIPYITTPACSTKTKSE